MTASDRPERASHVSAVAWLVAEKAILFPSGIIIGFWVVRVLGPADFGRFSTALSITAVFAGLAAMGIETLVLRRLAARDSDPGRVLVSAGLLRLAGSVVHVAICLLTALLLFPRDRTVIGATALLAFAAIFRVPDLIGLWLQAENRYRVAVQVRVASRLAGDLLRVVLILQGASLYWFAAALIFEGALISLALLVVGRDLLHVPPDKQLVASFYREGRMVLVSGMLAALYARLDQMVLYRMLGAAAGGQYAAAVRVSELFNLVVVSISAVAAAHFGRLHAKDDHEFDRELLRYHRLMLAGGLTISLLLSAFAGLIVRGVYGAAFAPAAAVLRVHAWTVVLVFVSAALEPWFYHYEKLGYYVVKTLLALVFAVPAVWFGTRYFGPLGTAAAVVATYAVSVYMTNLAVPQLRSVFRLQMKAFWLRRSRQ